MQFEQTHSWVLASSSPRRVEFLNRYGFKFDIVPPNLIETVAPDELPPATVQRLAQLKAQAVLKNTQPGLVIAADSLVAYQGQAIFKPENFEQAYATLQQLNGQLHQVYTAFVVEDAVSGQRIEHLSLSEVQFKKLPLAFLRTYAKSKDPYDKSGAYSVQGLGTFLVDSVKGSVNSVIGFPIEVFLLKMFEKKWISLPE